MESEAKSALGRKFDCRHNQNLCLSHLSCLQGWVLSSNGYGQTTCDSSTIYTGPCFACQDTIRAVFDNEAAFSFTVSIVEPVQYFVESVAVLSAESNEAGAGMVLGLSVLPHDVSFYKIKTREVSKPAINVNGYFADPNVYPFGLPDHDPRSGDAMWVPVDSDNSNEIDTASTGILAPPWRDGSVVWPIPTERIKNPRVTSLSELWYAKCHGYRKHRLVRAF